MGKSWRWCLRGTMLMSCVTLMLAPSIPSWAQADDQMFVSNNGKGAVLQPQPRDANQVGLQPGASVLPEGTPLRQTGADQNIDEIIWKPVEARLDDRAVQGWVRADQTSRTRPTTASSTGPSAQPDRSPAAAPPAVATPTTGDVSPEQLVQAFRDHPPDAGRIRAEIAGADRLPTLDSSLNELVRLQRSRGGTIGRSEIAAQGLRGEDDRVHVEIEHTGPTTAGVLEAIRLSGGAPLLVYDDLASALIPVSGLEILARHPSVRFVRSTTTPHANAVTAESVAKTGANSWHTAGFNGTGVKIGVIDTSYGGWQTSQTNGELPPGNRLVTNFTPCNGTGFDPNVGNHGLQMAELVYDMAPGATIYLICAAENTPTTLRAALTYAQQQGIQIVTVSQSAYNLNRADGTGSSTTPNGIVRDARQGGIFWIDSAGNRQQNHWMGNFSDPDGDTFHNFDGTLEVLQYVQFGGSGGRRIYLKWDEWTTRTTTLTVCWFTNSHPVNPSQCGQPSATSPVVHVDTPAFAANTAVGVYFVRQSGTGTPRLDLFVHNVGSFSPNVSAQSVTEPATSPFSYAVGAICWQNDRLESYSSLGPTIDGRTKPDIAGQTALSTSLSTNTGCPANGDATNGFNGTSAASPVVAGAAVLVKHANPGFTADQLQPFLQQRARDLGSSGFDNGFGHGALALGTPPTGGQGPANDMFAQATVLNTLPASFNVPSTSSATVEGGEPTIINCGTGQFGIGKTVWYRYTVPTSRTVQISTEGSNFDTTVVAWRNATPGNFPFGYCDDDSGTGTTSLMSFPVLAGETYMIQVGGFFSPTTGSPADAASGNLILNISGLGRLTVTTSGAGSVSSSPPGISCQSDCVEDYPFGTNVTLTGTPSAGHGFSHWTGACFTTVPTCLVPITGDMSAAANFVSCTPRRPNVGVLTTKNGDGRLRVSITAGAGVLKSVTVNPNGSIVSVVNGPTNMTTVFVYIPSTLTTAATLIVERTTSPGVFVGLNIVDGCGPWGSFAGAGTAPRNWTPGP